MVNAALAYTGDVLVTRVVPDDAAWANTAIQENSKGELVRAIFDFTPGTKEVKMYPTTTDIHGNASMYSEDESLAELEKVQLGSWIYPDGADASSAGQVVNRIVDDENHIVTLTLDRTIPEDGNHTGNAYVFVPFSEVSLSDINDVNLFSNPEGNMLYYFYAFGAGKYYNKLLIRGTRNTDLEKYMMDDDGNVLYKYMYMDIGIYEMQDNGNQKLLEGPWTISLIPRYPGDGGQVKDPTTGLDIFIEEVINDNSNLIRCVASSRDPVTDEPNAEFPAVTRLIEDENKRLQVMLMLSTYTPLGTTNVAASSNGITFKNGSDGTGQYNSSDNIQPSAELLGKVGRAFSGQLTVNGIDQLREDLYPVYKPDYIVRSQAILK